MLSARPWAVNAIRADEAAPLHWVARQHDGRVAISSIGRVAEWFEAAVLKCGFPRSFRCQRTPLRSTNPGALLAPPVRAASYRTVGLQWGNPRLHFWSPQHVGRPQKALRLAVTSHGGTHDRAHHIGRHLFGARRRQGDSRTGKGIDEPSSAEGADR